MASHPEFFWLFIILGPVAIILLRRFFTGRRQLRDLAGAWRGSRFYELYSVKSFFISAGIIIFLTASILALVGFPGKQTPVSYEPVGTDIIFVVDISESMKAEDVSPSRLGAASRIIRSVCENTPDGRFGVVVFKGKGIKMIPSTEDVESILNFLNILSPDLLTSPGSNIADGIDKAVSSFTKTEERNKYIILLSDGEMLEGSLIEAGDRAAAAGVTVHSIGIGSEEGTRIPLADGGYLTDPAGETVVTRLQPAALKHLSETTGGNYYNEDDGSLLADLIDIARGTSVSEESRYRIVVKENYRMFLVIALLGLLLYRAVKVVKWKNLF